MTKAWLEAQRHLAGGVNSPVRAFRAVGGEPVFMSQGLGPYLFDREGNAYIDFCLSWGAILTGHADALTVAAIQSQAAKGTSFGTVTEQETALAREIKKSFPRMEKIRFTSSGTEAVMSAIRLARGFTRRERIVKFEGCYHGHADSLLVKAGSGLATLGRPSSRGVPKALAELTTALPYNDARAAGRFLSKSKDVACVIVEPIAANMGLIPGREDFLRILKKKSVQTGALLIFDEVITGFRVARGGAQHFYGIQPDITILGKIIGGGLPIGAFGASSQIMKALAPTGGVYQAGTLSGNPLSMAAGLSVLSRLSDSFYQTLNAKSRRFITETRKVFKKRKAPIRLESVGSLFTFFFHDRPPRNFEEARRCDQAGFRRFFHRALRKGIYLPPSAFETCFLSASHEAWALDQTIQALKKC